MLSFLNQSKIFHLNAIKVEDDFNSAKSYAQFLFSDGVSASKWFKVRYFCTTSGKTIVKGSIAKRIPKLVTLKKDKTYSWCSCGLSKKQPFCDGSHKNHPDKLQPIHFNPTKDGRFLLCQCKQTNNRPYCDYTHVKTFIPEGLRKALNIKL